MARAPERIVVKLQVEPSTSTHLLDNRAKASSKRTRLQEDAVAIVRSVVASSLVKTKALHKANILTHAMATGVA